jgi:hypothetical protein
MFAYYFSIKNCGLFVKFVAEPVSGVELDCCTQCGRRLEDWPNTAARLAGWRRVECPGRCNFVRDEKAVPPVFSVLYQLP